MTNEQIEAKALEEFPVLGDNEYDDPNASRRAAFIKGCQYAAAPSAVSREEAKKWAESRWQVRPDERSDNQDRKMDKLSGALHMYDYLAPLLNKHP